MFGGWGRNAGILRFAQNDGRGFARGIRVLGWRHLEWEAPMTDARETASNRCGLLVFYRGRQVQKQWRNFRVPTGKSLRVKMILSDLQVTVLGGVSSARRNGLVWSGVAVLAAQMALTPGGVAQTPHYQSPITQGQVNAPVPQLSLPLPAPITPNGTVVEDVIVQVNDQIINRSDLERAEQQLEQDAATSKASPEAS